MIMLIGDEDGVFDEDDERYGIDGERDNVHQEALRGGGGA